MSDDEFVSDHAWEFGKDKWTCAKCGHAFPWKDLDKIPQQFSPDGSPARGDPAWIKFQIVGLMSFIDACRGLPEKQRKKLAKLSGMPDDVGTHAMAFKHCLFEQQANDLLSIDEIMES